MKIALFKSTITDTVVVWDELFGNIKGLYVRVSEWVDVVFPMLPTAEANDALNAAKARKLSALYAEIAALKGE